MYNNQIIASEDCPLVSVVIPTYNSASVLSRAIDSVLNQTYNLIEVIIVDDCSTDNTQHVVEGYDDPRIQCKHLETNIGAAGARNVGIDISNGEYVAFLDADDAWLPKKLESQIEILGQRDDEWVAVHCARRDEAGFFGGVRDWLAGVVGTEDRNASHEGGKELIGEILCLNIRTGSSTLLVKRDVVVEIGGFDVTLDRHQDWEFLIRVLQRGNLAYIEEPLVIKHATGRPPAQVFEKAKQKLLDKHADEIRSLEAKGYNVTRLQNLHLAKIYIEEGKIREGITHVTFRDVRFPEYLSLVWSFSVGLITLINSRS